MSTDPPVNHLARLFEAHGLPFEINEDWVVPHSRLPAMRAIWIPGQRGGQLDIQVAIDEGVTIIESFAGRGDGEAALRDAFQSFIVNSFHVLLAGLWDRNDPEQVTTEDWPVNGRTYRAFIGNFGTRSTEASVPPLPAQLFARLETAVRRELLSDERHWFRIFVGNAAGSCTFEALKDNEHWPAGVGVLEHCVWPKTQGYYSVRLFVLLRTE